MGTPDLDHLLGVAVTAVGGQTRAGQVEMAHAVRRALRDGDPLLVQAGTGTGKSLAYLVPAIAHTLERRDRRVVIATATLALQRQLVAHDLPLIADALTAELGRAPEFALLKGRNNYVCRHKIDGGRDEDDEDALFDASAVSELGRQVLRVREWVSETDTGDRDDLVPGVSDRVWNAVSVSARECLTAAKCPFGTECFAEAAREQAREADVVVTNHALLAIATFDSEIQVLPEHDAVVIDEAHELVSRATGATSGELTAAVVDRAVRRSRKHADERTYQQFEMAFEAFRDALDEAEPRRYPRLPEELADALGQVRDTARQVFTAITKNRDKSGADEGGRRQAQAAVEQVFELADRILAGAPDDVVWLDRNERAGGGRSYSSLRVAPLSVSEQLRHRLFARAHTVLTSATLRLGGDFDGVARTLGLYPEERADRLPADATAPDRPTRSSRGSQQEKSQPKNSQPEKVQPENLPEPGESGSEEGDGPEDGQRQEPDKPVVLRWNALDVGSPFDYPKQGILYIAKHLDPPGRDGIRPDQLDEIAGLVEAAGGRTLGLFSSQRGAQAAAEAMRERLEFPVLCQGEDSLPQLIAAFAADPKVCLFGTLSLWQGVNVPGPSCQLVLIDRIPFPRPDDPLAAARQEFVARNGGNGFMAVAGTHAALLLAQGAGRLIRASGDRGAVAVLDSRLATARYASFLRASLPPFWQTSDPQVVRAALRRLDTGD
jgi:ATP-dependent DNA helicase DinG